MGASVEGVDRELLEKQYRKAYLYGRRRVKDDHARDFAAWTSLKILEGRFPKTPLRMLFVDWLRETRGETRRGERYRPNEALKAVNRAEVIKTVEDHHNMDEALSRLSLNQSAISAIRLQPLGGFSHKIDRKIQAAIGRHKRAEQYRAFFILHYIWGMNKRDLAHVFGLSEARIGQIMNELNARIQKALKLEMKGDET
jgi:hypothetical protein